MTLPAAGTGRQQGWRVARLGHLLRWPRPSGRSAGPLRL